MSVVLSKRKLKRATENKKAARKLAAEVRKNKANPKATSPKNKRAGSSPARRKFEGASKSKRLSGWRVDDNSANSDIAQGLPVLRSRARDLRKNNPYAAKGIQVITSNVVGTGIVTQFRGGQAKTCEENWADWAETTLIDYDGRHTIYGLQGLVMDAVAESGECLIRRRVTVGLRFPFQYQVLESDFIDGAKTELADRGNSIIQGIEFTPQGKVVGYWLFNSHPGGIDNGYLKGEVDSTFIPAEEIRHVYRMDRPGQARGVPWLAPVIVRLKDFDDMEDAQLMRQKIAACFAGFMRDIDSDFYPELDDGDLLGTDEHGEDDGYDLPDRVSPGMLEELPRGKMMEFADPPSVENYAEYAATVLHAIAAGLGITYEALTGDYSKLNYSSGRMGRLEMQRNIRIWQERLIHVHMLEPIVADFKAMLGILGKDIGLDTKHVHVNPPVELIDPTKEVGAEIEKIRGGLSTLSDSLLALGKDPKRHLQQFADDLALLDQLGLKLTTDPRVELSARGKNKVTGEVGDEGKTDGAKKGSRSTRSTPSNVRALNVQRGKANNGRRVVNRRAS